MQCVHNLRPKQILGPLWNGMKLWFVFSAVCNHSRGKCSPIQDADLPIALEGNPRHLRPIYRAFYVKP